MGVQQSSTGQMDITSVVRGVEQHLSLTVSAYSAYSFPWEWPQMLS